MFIILPLGSESFFFLFFFFTVSSSSMKWQFPLVLSDKMHYFNLRQCNSVVLSGELSSLITDTSSEKCL